MAVLSVRFPVNLGKNVAQTVEKCLGKLDKRLPMAFA
jgi:hypothetical protein